MSFKDYCISKDIAPICTCTSCEDIYNDLRRSIDIVHNLRKDNEELMGISINHLKSENQQLKDKLNKAIECIEKLIPIIDAKGEDCQYHETRSRTSNI